MVLLPKNKNRRLVLVGFFAAVFLFSSFSSRVYAQESGSFFTKVGERLSRIVESIRQWGTSLTPARRFWPLLGPGSYQEETPTQETTPNGVGQSSTIGAGKSGGLMVANPILPSVTGVTTDKFSGVASFSYPLALPPGPGGFVPSLALSYSSGNVDDMHHGSRCWDDRSGSGNPKYIQQASYVGLGWQLSGLGYVVRDPGSWRDTKIADHGVRDDRYYLVFPGGAAELINDAPYDQQSDQWKTKPELFLKIKHRHRPQGGEDGCQTIGYDTEPWEVTTKDGTKYYFGSPISTAGDDRGRFCSDEDCTQIFGTSEESTGLDVGSGGDVILNRDKNGREIPNASLATEYGLAYCAKDGKAYNRLLPQKWLLRKIVDTHGNTIEFRYEARVKKAARQTSGTWCPKSGSGKWCPDFYTHEVRPVKVIYGKNGAVTVELSYEARDDFRVPAYELDNCDLRREYDDKYWINFFSRGRLRSIDVKVSGQLVRRYELDYSYTTDLPGNVKVKHSLLTKITQRGSDGVSSLPPYTFIYEAYNYGGDNYNGNETLLRAVDNGYGGRTTFTYDYVRPHTTKGRTHRIDGGLAGSSGYGYEDYGNFRARVRRKTVEDGMGNSYRVDYDYFKDDGSSPSYGNFFVRKWVDQGSHIPFSGYRFLGFPLVRKTLYKLDGSKLAVDETHYYGAISSKDERDCFQPDPRAGRAWKNEVATASGQVLTSHETKFLVRPLGVDVSCEKVSSDSAYFVAPVEDIRTTGGKTAKVEFTLYDQYGNLKETVYHGDIGKSGDEKTIYTEYYPNETKWILDRPAFVNIYEGDTRNNPGGEKLVTQTINYYDGASDYHTPPDKGDLTKVERGKGPDLSRMQPPCTFWGLVSTRYEYDSSGNRVKEVDSRGNETRTEYDETYGVYPRRIINALGQSIRRDYDYVLGVPKSITDPNGNTTTIEYDRFGRRKRVVQPALSARGGLQPEVRFDYFDYHEKGVPISVLTSVKKDDGGFLKSVVHYDGLGRQIQRQSEWEHERIILSNTAYDSQGKPEKTSLPYEVTASLGDYIVPDWDKPHTQTSYDALGRVVRVRNPDGTETRSEYKGWETISFDEENHKTLTENDAYGRVIKSQTFEGDGGKSVYTTTETEYDVLGNVIKVVERDGDAGDILSSSTASYDSHGWKTSSSDPDLGSYRYCYDSNGNLLWQEDPKRQLISFEYDPLNRVVKKELPDGSSVFYKYDQGSNGVGRLSSRSFTGSGVTEQFSYDELGRVVRTVQAVESKDLGRYSYATESTYDLIGNVLKVTYPDGEVVTNDYDGLGRLVKVSGKDIYVSDISYTPQGEVKAIVRGDGTTATYEYDSKNRRLTHLSSPILSYSYDYYPSGNIKTWRGFSGGRDLTFSYDDFYRLKAVSGFYTASYKYDKLWRMVAKEEGGATEITFSSDFPLHAPKKVSGVDFQYDADGNLLSDGTRTIAWDAENRPVQVELRRSAPSPEPGPLPITPRPESDKHNEAPRVPDKSAFHNLLGAETEKFEKLRLLLRQVFSKGPKKAEYDLNGDGVVNGLDFLLLSLGRLPRPPAPPAPPQPEELSYIVKYYYDGGGGRVLRQLTLRDGKGKEELKERKLYVNKYFAKDLVTDEVEKYYFAGGKRVALRKGNSLYFLHTDHLGSTRAITDRAGNVIARYDYWPYGAPYNQQPQGDSPLVERLYTSQIYDQGSDLYFYNARYYNPELGTFISADQVQGPNRYAYVSDNPVNITDSSGNIAPVKVPRKAPTGWGSGGGGGGVGGHSDRGFNLFEALFGRPEEAWVVRVCGGDSGCIAQHAFASVTYSAVGWDPLGVLSQEEKVEMQVGLAFMGLLGTVSMPGAFPAATEVAEKLTNLPSKWRPKGISPNRARWASQHALRLFEEDEVMHLLSRGEIAKAQTQITRSGLGITYVGKGQLSRMFGTRPTNLATIRGGHLYMEKQVLNMSPFEQALEFAHEYAAWVFESRLSLGRGHPAFGAATRAVDVIMSRVYRGP